MKSKKRDVAIGRKNDQRTGRLFAAYYFTIIAFALAAMFPENRVWGINQWAYFPQFWQLLIAAVGVLIIPIFSLIKVSHGGATLNIA